MLDKLVSEHLEAVGLSDPFFAQSQYVRVFRELVSSQPHSNPQQLEYSGWLASDLLDAARYWPLSCAASPTEQDQLDYKSGVIWRHRDLKEAFQTGKTSRNACDVDVQEVVRVAERYVQQNLRSTTFEMLLVDALVAIETYQFGEEIKKNPLSFTNPSIFSMFFAPDYWFMYSETKGNWAAITTRWLRNRIREALVKLGLFFVLPVTVAWVAFASNYQTIGAIAAGLAMLSIAVSLTGTLLRLLGRAFKTPQETPFEKALKLHAKMIDAYRELRAGAMASPRRIREQLAKAADAGAGWEPIVFTILDLAASRYR